MAYSLPMESDRIRALESITYLEGKQLQLVNKKTVLTEELSAIVLHLQNKQKAISEELNTLDMEIIEIDFDISEQLDILEDLNKKMANK